jgi:hypothetical protein
MVHWRLDDKPGLLGQDGLLESLVRTLKKRRGTAFIACHLAHPDYDLTRLGRMLDHNPKLYHDFAARMSEISTIPRFANQFFPQRQDHLRPWYARCRAEEDLPRDALRIFAGADTGPA